MDDMERDDVLTALQHARALLMEYHDVVDTDHPQVQRPNWAMQATNELDEVIALVAAQ